MSSLSTASTSTHAAPALAARCASGLFLSAALVALVGFGGLSTGLECGGDCAGVLQSSWAYLFGQIPLRWAGAVFYLALAILSLFAPRNGLTHAAAGVVVTAGFWFIAVQILIIGQICPGCCLAHALAISGGIVLFQLQGIGASSRILPFSAIPAALGVLVAGSPWVLKHEARPEFVNHSTSGQLVALTSQNAQLQLLDGQFTLDAASLPRLGNPDAEKAVVVIMNHACPHCARAVQDLREVMRELPPGKLAVYYVPVATKPEVAEAQAVLLALWAGDSEVHDQIVERLLSGSVSLSAAAVRAEAARLTSLERVESWLAADRLQAARARVVLHGQIAQSAHQRHGFKGLPQLWFPNGAELGAAEDSGFYFQALARHLGIERSMEPKLMVAQKEIQLGRTPAAGRHSYRLAISNAGKGALKLSGIQLPPGWSTSETFPLVLVAAENRSLEVELRSPVQTGPWQAEIQILSNADRSSGKIMVRGEAVAARESGVDRLELADIPEGSQSLSECHPFVPAQGFTFGEIQLQMEGFKAVWDTEERKSVRFEQTQLLPARGYVGSLSIPVQWSGSSLSWTVPNLEIPVAAHVRAPVIVTPLRVVLPPIRMEHAQQYTISIRPRDERSLLAPTVELPSALWAAGVTAVIGKPDTRQEVEITLNLPARFDSAAHVGSQIVLHSGLPKGSPTNLSIELSGRRNGRAAFAQSAPTFQNTQP